jgi:hypothetical protein
VHRTSAAVTSGATSDVTTGVATRADRARSRANPDRVCEVSGPGPLRGMRHCGSLEECDADHHWSPPPCAHCHRR